MYSGHWAECESGFIRAIETYRVIGLVREYGLALVTLIWLKTWQGHFIQVRPYLEELRQLGADTGDRHIATWAEFYGAIETARCHSLEQAITATRRAMDILIGLPDYLCYVEGLGQLAMYKVRLGDTDGAVALLEEADHWVKRKGCTPHLSTAPRLARAWTSVRAAENATQETQHALLRAAGEAARQAIRLGHVFAGAAPQGWCVMGSVNWLQSRRDQAMSAWSRALSIANALSSPYDIGLVQEEIARLSGDSAAWGAARDAFESIGAAVDLRRLESMSVETTQ